MSDHQQIFSDLVLLWAVIDPIGTVPVFISATAGRTAADRFRIARVAALTAAGILLFFIAVGELVLNAMGVPLLAFQISGGIILFLFALTMIFGESKPKSEEKEISTSQDVAIFPLATPSIASPGAMMAVVLLTRNDIHPFNEQLQTAALTLAVVAAAYGLMLGAGTISRLIGAGTISRLIGAGGASIVSRVMGMILASVAATQVLEGGKEYFG